MAGDERLALRARARGGTPESRVVVRRPADLPTIAAVLGVAIAAAKLKPFAGASRWPFMADLCRFRRRDRTPHRRSGIHSAGDTIISRR
jgi:hypothetical protein